MYTYLKKITFIGLLFLFIERKELCEARGEAKHEKLMIIPPFKTARAQSELFAFQCSQ